jgi:hypothetical protein
MLLAGESNNLLLEFGSCDLGCREVNGMRLDSSASFVDQLLGFPCANDWGVCVRSAPCPAIGSGASSESSLILTDDSPTSSFGRWRTFPARKLASNQSFVKKLEAYAKRLDSAR